VRLSELASFRGRFGLGIERDRHWTAQGPISAYIAAADEAGRIVDLPGVAATSQPDFQRACNGQP
jgi:hypothetical protein